MTPSGAACRRALPALAAVLLLTGCAGEGDGAGAAVGGGGPVRDVLLITVDTLRADSLGFAGNRRAATPVLDRLAAQGVVFANAHAHSVMTLPSHANLLTGRYPFDHGVRDNGGFVLADDVPTAATLLREDGFRTAAFVGAFPLDARYGLGRGFEVYDDRYPEGGRAGSIPERRGDRVVGPALAWWREHAGERRFLWLHLFDPHAPYEPPEPFASRFADDPYLGEVAATDSYLAPLLEPLLEPGRDRSSVDGAGEAGSTLVVFTSDHGEALGEHGELTHGLFAYEETLRVPLVLWRPGLGPERSDRPARHVDLLPTVLEAAGVEAPEGLPGRSLLAPPAADEGPVDSYFEAMNAHLTRGWAPLRGVLRDDHKLISLPLPELYDLSQDPEEEQNRYAADERRARELSRRIPAEALRPVEPSAVGAVEARALRSLGYLAGGAAPRASYGPEDDPKTLVALDRKSHQVLDLLRRGRLEEATRLAREVVAARPSMAIAHYHLAQVLLERGLLPEAIAAMEAAVERGAASADLLSQLGLSLAQAGRPERAVELLAPLAEGSADPELVATYGLALSDAGRHEEARSALGRIFDLDPTNPRGHELLALVALRRERWPEAETEARRALDAADDRPEALNYLGVALYRQGRPAEALDAWRRAAELDPADLEVLFNLYRVAAETGDRRLAADALRRFIASAPPERFGADLERARSLLAELEAQGAGP